MSAPNLEPGCGSWIIQCMTTGEALFETFDRKIADQAAGQNHLMVYTATQWLSEINGEDHEYF